LKLEAVLSSETLVNFHQTTRCYIPEDSTRHSHHFENLKSNTLNLRSSLDVKDQVLHPHKTDKFTDCIDISPVTVQSSAPYNCRKRLEYG
jgi:hypothetical protein